MRCVYSQRRQIKGLSLSFRNAKELRKRAELLPSGPRWKSSLIPTSHPTKRPVYLYWRDPLELLEYLFNNPLFADAMELVPYRLYKTAERLCRVYSEWMSADDAWQMQVSLVS